MAVVLERNEIGQALRQMHSPADHTAGLAPTAGWFYLGLTAAASSQITAIIAAQAVSGASITPPSRTQSEIPTAVRFKTLADEWKRDTRFKSSLTAKVMHPSYQAIIGMGKEALPFILDDLQRTRAHWLWALRAITQEDPVPEGVDFGTAVEVWLTWGRNLGKLSH